MFLRTDETSTGRSATRELVQMMNDFIRGSPFLATYLHEIPTYHVRLTCGPGASPRSSFLRFRRADSDKRTADIAITDAAGGHLMGPDVENQEVEIKKKALEFATAVRQSQGVVFCLPADVTETGAEADDKQIQVINQLAVREQIALRRLVICLTKYEAQFLHMGSEALDRALSREEFARIALEKLPTGLRRSLVALASKAGSKSKNGPIEVCITPASTYGFVRFNGCVNFNPLTGRLLTESGVRVPVHPRAVDVKPPYYREDVAISYWQPFFIVDPFVYAAFGDKGLLMWNILDLE
jgi:hypothetical protein